MDDIIKHIQGLEKDILSTPLDKGDNRLTMDDIEFQVLPLLCILTKSVGEKCGHQVGKKFDEIITAYISNLKLCKHVNGVDALNDQNRPVEIKSSTLTKTNHVNFNFHPIAHKRNQTKESYANTLYKDAIVKGDVLLSLEISKAVFGKIHEKNPEIIENGNKYYYRVTLDHRFMAEFIRQKILAYRDDKWKTVKNINIGGLFCHKCGKIHRVDLYKQASLSFDTINWTDLLNTKTPSQCV